MNLFEAKKGASKSKTAPNGGPGVSTKNPISKSKGTLITPAKGNINKPAKGLQQTKAGKNTNNMSTKKK
jgi:hypothetical protein